MPVEKWSPFPCRARRTVFVVTPKDAASCSSEVNPPRSLALSMTSERILYFVFNGSPPSSNFCRSFQILEPVLNLPRYHKICQAIFVIHSNSCL